MKGEEFGPVFCVSVNKVEIAMKKRKRKKTKKKITTQLFCFSLKKEEEKGSSHKSTRMSDISCE